MLVELVQYPPFLETLHEKRLNDQERQTDVDWGAPIDEQIDAFSLKDLEEFQTTDLSFLFNDTSKQIALDLHPTSISRILPSVEEGSLYAVIPQVGGTNAPNFDPFLSTFLASCPPVIMF